jgi:hypothetical protein
LPVDLADTFQRPQNVLAVVDLAAGDLCGQPFGNLLPGVRSGLPACKVARRAGLHQPGQAWIIGPRPSMLIVQRVAHGVIALLPSWRRYVHALAGGEFNTRHDDVNVLRSVRLFV